MYTFRWWRVVSLFCVFYLSAAAQQSTSTNGAQTSQAASLLQQSLVAMTGGAPISDVTMTGTVTATQSSGTTESGTITLVATAAGQSQITASLPSGTWTTTENYAVSPRTATYTGPNGTNQDAASQHFMGPSPAWFCPALLIAAASAQNFVATYVDQETLNGTTVQHVSIWPQSQNVSGAFVGVGQQVIAGPAPSPSPRLGQHDVYLSVSSMLPQVMTIWATGNVPQNSGKSTTLAAPILIPEHVQFFNYQAIQGIAVPLHIQFLVNGAVVMDIQLSSVRFNTGATITAS
jgi:hypothetical protein